MSLIRTQYQTSCGFSQENQKSKNKDNNAQELPGKGCSERLKRHLVNFYPSLIYIVPKSGIFFLYVGHTTQPQQKRAKTEAKDLIRRLSRTDTHLANKPGKDCFTPWSEIQIKTTKRYQITPTRVAKNQ